MGHGQEVTHLAFVETDLPLSSNGSQWAAKGQRTLWCGVGFVYML